MEKRYVYCVRLKQETEGLAAPPFPGALGIQIYEQISQAAWSDWLKYQTILVNENRLSLSDPNARYYLKEQMRQYFFGDPEKK